MKRSYFVLRMALSLLVALGFALQPLGALMARAAAPLDVIVNEWSQGNGGAKEWVELLVVNGPVDLRNWTLIDGNASGTLTFADVSEWSAVPAGTLIVVYNAADRDTSLPVDDSDFSDFSVVLAHNNAAFFSGTWPGFSNSTNTDNPHLRDETTATVHNYTTAPGTSPRPVASGAVHYLSNSAAGVATAGNWALIAASDVTPGTPNGGDNTTWVESLRPAAPTGDLSISKTAPAAIVIGDPIDYTIEILNNGIPTATGVVVTDTLPADTVLVSSTPTATMAAPGVYVWTLGDVLSGTLTTITLQVSTPLTATAGTTFVNNAALGTTGPDSVAGNNTDQTTTTAYPLVSIYDIQTVADPAVSDVSPYAGQTVWIEGIVTAAPAEIESAANNRMAVQAAAGGAYSGLIVHKFSGAAGSVLEGDEVRLLGTVADSGATPSFGLTLLRMDVSPAAYVVLSSGNPLPAPEVLPTGSFDDVDKATSEPWEGVLLSFEDATVTNVSLGFGEWYFDDGSGSARADDSGELDGNLNYNPVVGEYYASITGIGWYSFNNYKLEPRYDADIVFGAPPEDLTVSKSAPLFGAIGAPLQYTVQVQNRRALAAESVMLTDTLPAGVTLLSYSASVTATEVTTGTWLWNFGTIPANMTETVVLTVSVDAGLSSGTVLANQVNISTSTAGDDPANNSAQASTTLYPLVTIAQVQTPTDVNVSDASPYVNQRVWVEGVVTSAPGDIDNPTRMMVIQDPAGGAYSGLHVFKAAGFPDYPEGMVLRVLGLVKEYNGLTELDLGSGDAAIEVLGSVAPLAPELLTTAEFPDTGAAISEKWEGVYIQFEFATVTDDNLGYGEWYFDDGSGAVRADDLGEKDGDLNYLPANGDVYSFIRGIGWYSFSNYKLVPRSDADIALFQMYPQVSKAAPTNVDAGTLFTYTLTVQNLTGETLTGVVLTDVLPAENAAFAYALDGGTLTGDTVLWNLGDLADQQQVQAHFVMTATGDLGALITNEIYAVSAANYVTPTFGVPVVTTIGDYTPIPVIQGEGMTSPLEGFTVTTRGVVIGRLQGNSSVAGNFNGFYIQAFPGDNNPNTSDGIFVNHGTSSYTANVGDLVEVTGVVQEFDEYDGVDCESDMCVTQIAVSTANISVLSSGNPYTATTLAPVGDPAGSDAYYEAHEGMLMTLPFTATVVGPTSYGTIQVVPGNLGLTRVLRNTPYEGLPVGVRPDERYGSGAPNLIVGSIVSDVDGVLTFSYGDYLLVDQDGYTVDYESPEPTTPEAGLLPDEMSFTVGTFNTLNFDAADGATKMTKVFDTIVNMGAPAFLALQEVAADEVMPTLLADLATAGYPYTYTASHPDTGGHGVAMMWRTDLVTNLTWSDEYQGCSVYGSTSSDYDPLWDECRAQGEYPLFSRRPVVVTATVTLDGAPREIVAIAAHLKSKLGGYEADMRRLGQGEFLNALMAELDPEYGLVMGDLNDFEDSATLQALYANDVLTNTWYTLPADARWSYIFNGVSQILDHVLATPALAAKLDALKPLHNNAAFPFNPYSSDASVIWRTSDHDQLSARFTIPNPPPPPTYTVTFVYHDLEDVVQIGESLSLAGSFNGWSASATPMVANVNASVFTATVIFDALDTYEYKYIVQSGGDQWDWLNTANRSVAVTDGLLEVHDYRKVDVGYAVIAAPQSLTVTVGTTATLNGEVYIQNVTNPAGAARGVKAYLGYGMGNDMNTWTWVELTYTGQNGNNDVWSVSLLPEATGVYSYAVRFDGNWAGPNAAWTYGDTDGVYPGEPFEIENVGILTVIEPEPSTYTIFLPLIRR